MSNPLGRASATGFIAATLLLGFSEPALAADELNSGDTAWMLTSSLLVLLMTVPGVALFYGGMVRKKNVLATLMQSFAVCCMATVIWMAVGYSLAFSGEGPFVGDLDQLFLMGIGVDSMSGTIPESVFMMFQMNINGNIIPQSFGRNQICHRKRCHCIKCNPKFTIDFSCMNFDFH